MTPEYLTHQFHRGDFHAALGDLCLMLTRALGLVVVRGDGTRLSTERHAAPLLTPETIHELLRAYECGVCVEDLLQSLRED